MAKKSRSNIIVIDKPTDMTSHDVVDYVRKKTGVTKVGHAGTLDPFATGVLVILIGRSATKQSAVLSASEKEYLATIEFGRQTDTLDPEGEFIKQVPTKTLPEIKKTALKEVLEGFIGTYDQQIPRYSAKKIKGKKLYEKARRGEQFTPPTKTVTIHELELENLESVACYPQARIRVLCSAGTYIRALARDIGEKITVPAYLVALRRTRQGNYSLDQAVLLDNL